MNIMDRLTTLYNAGDVQRLHTVRTLHPHSVAEHVYGSMAIAVELCKLNQVPSVGLILQVLLYHDAPEVYTGDVPAPVKRESRELAHGLEMMEDRFYADTQIDMPSLNAKEYDIVKASDTLDLMFKCVREAQLGNKDQHIEVVMSNVLRYIRDQAYLEGVLSISDRLEKEWYRVRK